MAVVVLKTLDADETVRLGSELGRRLRPGDVVALYGDLGAGKTTFVKGIARGMGVAEEARSPTFTLIHEHPGEPPLYHIDLYRLAGAQEAEALGVEEYVYGEGVTVIEWADRMEELLPAERLDIELRVTGETEREMALRCGSERTAKIVEEVAKNAVIGD